MATACESSVKYHDNKTHVLPDSQIMCINAESETHLYCGLAVQFHDIATPLGAKIKTKKCTTKTHNVQIDTVLLPGVVTLSFIQSQIGLGTRLQTYRHVLFVLLQLSKVNFAHSYE